MFSGYLKNMKQDNDYVYGVTVQEYSLSGVTGRSVVIVTRQSLNFSLPSCWQQLISEITRENIEFEGYIFLARWVSLVKENNFKQNI